MQSKSETIIYYSCEKLIERRGNQSAYPVRYASKVASTHNQLSLQLFNRAYRLLCLLMMWGRQVVEGVEGGEREEGFPAFLSLLIGEKLSAVPCCAVLLNTYTSRSGTL